MPTWSVRMDVLSHIQTFHIPNLPDGRLFLCFLVVFYTLSINRYEAKLCKLCLKHVLYSIAGVFVLTKERMQGAYIISAPKGPVERRTKPNSLSEEAFIDFPSSSYSNLNQLGAIFYEHLRNRL